MAEITNRTDWREIVKNGVRIPQAVFKMKISGGNLRKGFEQYITVYMSFSDWSFDTLKDFVAGGQSARVTLAKNLRDNASESQINRLAEKGLYVHHTMVGDKSIYEAPEDRADMLMKFLKSLPEAEQKAFLEKVNNQ